MKLISCELCGDIFNLRPFYKQCSCGNAKGYYIDEDNIVYSGENVVLLGMNNTVYELASSKTTLDGIGIPLICYIIPYYSDSTIRVDDAYYYWHNRKSTEYFSKDIKKEWDRELDSIRNSNILKKIIYKLFKKFMFPSFPEYKYGKNGELVWKNKDK